MKVIVAGTMDFEDPSVVQELLLTAKPHIDGALDEKGCIAYSWTQCHLNPGRIQVYEEWESEEAHATHLSGEWLHEAAAAFQSFTTEPFEMQRLRQTR